VADRRKRKKRKKTRLKATQAIDPDYVKDRVLAMNEGVVGFVASKNKPLIVADVLKNSLFKEKEMAKRLRPGLHGQRSYACKRG